MEKFYVGMVALMIFTAFWYLQLQVAESETERESALRCFCVFSNFLSVIAVCMILSGLFADSSITLQWFEYVIFSCVAVVNISLTVKLTKLYFKTSN